MNPGTSLLIVEDDPLLAGQIRQSLMREGYDISGVATSFDEAVALMQKKPADLAVIDIKLQGPEDGVATARELQKIRWIPVIYITGEPAARVVERSFLEKPLRTRELLVQIDLALHNFHEGNIPAGLRQALTQPDAASAEQEDIFVLTDRTYFRVKQSEILYLKADRIYSWVYLSQEGIARIGPKNKDGSLHVSMSMGRILSRLSSNFYRLSRSLVINVEHIDRLGTDSLYMEDKRIDLPEGGRKALMTRLGVIKV
jgi:DNA-binding LytR/AlgR family response regulator